MPSQRRTRLVGLLVALTVLTLLYMTSAPSSTRTSAFYVRTSEALQSREYAAAAKQRDEESVGSRLAAAEKAAKDSAGEKGARYLESVDGAGVAGRVKLSDDDKDKDKDKKVQGVATVGGKVRDSVVGNEDETAEEHEAEMELNRILKRGPIIIFSKSYCPHSAAAKHVLLEKYTITPAPHVVELDLHPLGPQIQALLAVNTGRRTVPNVLVQGRSIGGGDDILELDADGRLEEVVKEIGGSRVEGVAKVKGVA